MSNPMSETPEKPKTFDDWWDMQMRGHDQAHVDSCESARVFVRLAWDAAVSSERAGAVDAISSAKEVGVSEGQKLSDERMEEINNVGNACDFGQALSAVDDLLSAYHSAIARAQKAEAERDAAEFACEEAINQCDRLAAENARIREALKFYAEGRHIHIRDSSDIKIDGQEQIIDRGEIALAAVTNPAPDCKNLLLTIRQKIAQINGEIYADLCKPRRKRDLMGSVKLYAQRDVLDEILPA